MKKKLKFKEIALGHSVYGYKNAKIGEIKRGRFGWNLEPINDTWWTSDCLMEVAKFMEDLSNGKPSE